MSLVGFTPQAPPLIAPTQQGTRDLLSIPLEVREKIYYYLLPPFRVSRIGGLDSYHATDPIDAMGININILLVNRQTKGEVEDRRPGGVLSETSSTLPRSGSQLSPIDVPAPTITAEGQVSSMHLKYIHKLVLDAGTARAKALVKLTDPNILPRLRCVEIVLGLWVRDFEDLIDDTKLPRLIDGIDNETIFQADNEIELLGSPVTYPSWEAQGFQMTRIICNMNMRRVNPKYALHVLSRMLVKKPASSQQTLEAVIDMKSEQLVSVGRVPNESEAWSFTGTKVDLRPAYEVAKPKKTFQDPSTVY